MLLTETQEKMLCEVLDQLMTSYTVSAEELSATHDYLFGDQPIAPFFTDKELFETVLYLRETIVSYELADLKTLVIYYDNRKKQMHSYLSSAAAAMDDLPAFKEALGRTHHVLISDSIAITSEELDTLTGQISAETNRVFENCYSKVIRFFESPPLPATGEKDIHSAVKKHVRELMTNKPNSLLCKLSVNTVLPYGIKNYVEQFASHHKGEQVFIMQFAKHLRGNVQMLASEYRQLFAYDCLGALWASLHGSHPPDYSAIMNIVKREETITDNSFKIQLTEWLIYSKLIISHDQCDEPKQEPPAWLDQSFESLFQSAPVRVYGGGDMQYWIHNLFEAKLSLKKWVILKRFPGHFWLTSDNPGFMININELQDGFTQVIPRHSLLEIRPDSVLYYPLSKDYCLKLEPNVASRDEAGEDTPIDFVDPSEGELDFVNGVTLSTYKKVVITNQRKTLQQIQFNYMAKNGKPGDGHRDGQVNKRSQTHNPKNDKWVKRNTENGQFIDQKADDKPFKGVRKEK